MPSALDVVRNWKARMRARDFDHIDEVVDIEGYLEICLGLTGWTTGYDVAFRNYIKNMIDPWSEQETSDQEVLEAGGAVIIRSRVTGHSCRRIPGRSGNGWGACRGMH